MPGFMYGVEMTLPPVLCCPSHRPAAATRCVSTSPDGRPLAARPRAAWTATTAPTATAAVAADAVRTVRAVGRWASSARAASTTPNAATTASGAPRSRSNRFGFGGVFSVEHYLAPQYQMFHQPTFLARVAAESGSMLVGTGVSLVSLHNPVELAKYAANAECSSSLCDLEAKACTQDCASAACPSDFACADRAGKRLCVSSPSEKSGCAVGERGAADREYRHRTEREQQDPRRTALAPVVQIRQRGDRDQRQQHRRIQGGDRVIEHHRRCDDGHQHAGPQRR